LESGHLKDLEGNGGKYYGTAAEMAREGRGMTEQDQDLGVSADLGSASGELGT
jgi:hypothetical protein